MQLYRSQLNAAHTTIVSVMTGELVKKQIMLLYLGSITFVTSIHENSRQDLFDIKSE